MTARDRTRLPGSAPASTSPGRARRFAARLWENRPSLGALACLLAGPGLANVVLGWPLWWTAAGQWSLWLLLMVAVSLTEARHPAPPAHARLGSGHDVPPRLGDDAPTAPGGSDGEGAGR